MNCPNATIDLLEVYINFLIKILYSADRNHPMFNDLNISESRTILKKGFSYVDNMMYDNLFSDKLLFRLNLYLDITSQVEALKTYQAKYHEVIENYNILSKKINPWDLPNDIL